MFIASTKAFMVRRADGTPYAIPRGFIGEIPEDVANSKLVQLALKDGSIAAPSSKKDKDIDKAIKGSEEKAVEAQIEKEEAAAAKEEAKKAEKEKKKK